MTPADKLRQCIESADYGKALAALAEYSEFVEAACRESAAPDGDLLARQRETGSLLRWALHTVAAGRAQCLEQLGSLSEHAAYRHPRSSENTWSVDA